MSDGQAAAMNTASDRQIDRQEDRQMSKWMNKTHEVKKFNEGFYFLGSYKSDGVVPGGGWVSKRGHFIEEMCGIFNLRWYSVYRDETVNPLLRHWFCYLFTIMNLSLKRFFFWPGLCTHFINWSTQRFVDGYLRQNGRPTNWHSSTFQCSHFVQSVHDEYFIMQLKSLF